MSDLRKMAREAGFNTEFDDYVIDHWKRFEKFARLINAAALAQPEPEPVAWMYEYDGMMHDTAHPPIFVLHRWKTPVGEPYTETPLYATPPQRKPLTDEEIIEAIKHISHNEMSAFAIARAIERIIK